MGGQHGEGLVLSNPSTSSSAAFRLRHLENGSTGQRHRPAPDPLKSVWDWQTSRAHTGSTWLAGFVSDLGVQHPRSLDAFQYSHPISPFLGVHAFDTHVRRNETPDPSIGHRPWGSTPTAGRAVGSMRSEPSDWRHWGRWSRWKEDPRSGPRSGAGLWQGARPREV